MASPILAADLPQAETAHHTALPSSQRAEQPLPAERPTATALLDQALEQTDGFTRANMTAQALEQYGPGGLGLGNRLPQEDFSNLVSDAIHHKSGAGSRAQSALSHALRDDRSGMVLKGVLAGTANDSRILDHAVVVESLPISMDKKLEKVLSDHLVSHAFNDTTPAAWQQRGRTVNQQWSERVRMARSPLSVELSRDPLHAWQCGHHTTELAVEHLAGLQYAQDLIQHTRTGHRTDNANAYIYQAARSWGSAPDADATLANSARTHFLSIATDPAMPARSSTNALVASTLIAAHHHGLDDHFAHVQKLPNTQATLHRIAQFSVHQRHDQPTALNDHKQGVLDHPIWENESIGATIWERAAQDAQLPGRVRRRAIELINYS